MTTTPPPARMLLAALLGAAVLSPAAHLEAAAPCPGGRFVVAGAGLGLGATGPTARVVEIGAGPGPIVALAGPCTGPAVGTRRERRLATAIRVRLTQCAAARRVRLKLRLEHGCAALTGSIIVRGRTVERFVALPSACGDGFVDAQAREACEPGSAGCNPDCTLAQPLDDGSAATGGAGTAPVDPAPPVPPTPPTTPPTPPPPPAPPTAEPTVRRLEIVNKHQYNLIGLTVNGTARITEASQVVPPGERFVVGDVPPDSDVQAELGPVFGEPPLFVRAPGAVEHDGGTDVAFILPTSLGELLTAGAPSRDWASSFVDLSGTTRLVGFRFAIDGSLTLFQDGQATHQGSVTLTDWQDNATQLRFSVDSRIADAVMDLPFTSFTFDGAVFTPGAAVPPPNPAADPDRQPRITSISPDSGRPGDPVIIEGENFDRQRDGSPWTDTPSYHLELPKAGANPIFHVAMPFEVISPTVIKAIIPEGAASGPIVLAEGSNPRTAGFASSPVALTVLP